MEEAGETMEEGWEDFGGRPDSLEEVGTQGTKAAHCLSK